MPNSIQIKRTPNNTAPTSLLFGELAWSENGYLYVGRNNGTVVPLMAVQGLMRVASENIAAGAFVNLWTYGTTKSCRNANASLGYSANAFVTQAVTAGNSILCLPPGQINSQALVNGSPTTTGYYCLSSTNPGQLATLANAPASGSGYIFQVLGYASDTDFLFCPQVPITRG